MLRVRVLISLLAALLCVGCIAPCNTKMTSVKSGSWEGATRVEFDNSDTILLRSIAVALRYNSSFSATELPLNIKVITPDGRHFEEPFVLHIGNVKRATTISQSVAIPYRQDVLFSMEGTYTFIFEPQSAVKGVEAIGVELYLIDN
ncbi:MAG: hypothetical protein IKA49_02290 [Alistipes sp.]|nr:hypothetical protein [Alistipes sp.]